MHATLGERWRLGGLPRVRLSRPAWLASQAVAWGVLLVLVWAIPGDMRDTGAYYNLQLHDVYANSTFLSTGYVYSPAFALLTEPLRWLPIEVMEGLVRTASAVALGWLVTPFAGIALILIGYPGLRAELGVGNIDLLVAAALVFVLSKPWLWPVLLLTKVSPGVGLAWYAARREWRSLGIALGVTVVVALVTLPFVGIGAWLDWWRVLTGANVGIAEAYTGLPILPRLIAAAALVGLSGIAGWVWVLPIAVAISFADPNVAHWLVILAIPRLVLKMPEAGVTIVKGVPT